MSYIMHPSQLRKANHSDRLRLAFALKLPTSAADDSPQALLTLAKACNGGSYHAPQCACHECKYALDYDEWQLMRRKRNAYDR
jgi:hypothetical protein